jgi:hypothetical protein
MRQWESRTSQVSCLKWFTRIYVPFVSSDRCAQDEGRMTRWAANFGGNRLISPGASPRPIPPASSSTRREGARQAVPPSHPSAAGRGRRTAGGARRPSSGRDADLDEALARRDTFASKAAETHSAENGQPRSASSTTQPAILIAVSWPRSSRRPLVCSGSTPTRRSQAAPARPARFRATPIPAVAGISGPGWPGRRKEPTHPQQKIPRACRQPRAVPGYLYQGTLSDVRSGGK